jgi:hypothetical protein
VSLEIDAPGPHLLRLAHVERQASSGDERRDCDDSSRFHEHAVRPFKVILAGVWRSDRWQQ